MELNMQNPLNTLSDAAGLLDLLAAQAATMLVAAKTITRKPVICTDCSLTRKKTI